ncbi:MAG TPA: ParB/RepB/Spo0J family partition protein [Bdellovibrionota bacterium]|nr:ParB/RepB/Spo0J family partition protein [Bdellovibrionota bacterium]
MSEIRDLTVRTVEIQDFSFRFQKPEESSEAVIRSLEEVGLIQPIVIRERRAETGISYQLIDGFVRFAFAQRTGLSEIPCRVLPWAAPDEAVFRILLQNHDSWLQPNVPRRIRFILFALGAGFSRDLVREHLPRLGFAARDEVLAKCEKVGGLPLPVFSFCEEKNFSFKQCFQFTQQPVELLNEVFAWRDRVTLTASLLEEFIVNLKDYFRASGLRIDDFVKDKEFSELMNSDVPPLEKTGRLRQLILRRRFPILTSVNSRLEALQTGMGLPGNISVEWDRTLERREVKLSIRVREPEEWPKALAELRRPEVGNGLENILAEL